MTLPSVLPESFFARSVLEVAPDLLGCRLVRLLKGERLAGLIIETEAYNGEADRACHARSGRTKRNSVMYGPPGRAYIYFTYGMHWMLNCVTQPEGQPTAVLIRALVPTEGLSQIAARRAGRPSTQWTDGPAKLCQAFGIDGSLNEANLTLPSSGLWIETGLPIRPEWVETGPRVGIDYAGEPWVSQPWRYRARLPQNLLELHPG
jgi:DNA-3-methyladenine glycosylase